MSRIDIFESPSKRKSGIINLEGASPRKRRSPRKKTPQLHTELSTRGIIRLGSPRSNRTGRNGLRSPIKRGVDELNRIALLKALSTKRTLLEDGDEDFDDGLDGDEYTVVEKIIKASKEDGILPVHVEHEEEHEVENHLAGLNENLEQEFQLNAQQQLSTMDDKALFLDGYEGYFDQHKSRQKTSGHTMNQAVSLEHDKFLESTLKLSGSLEYSTRSQMKKYISTLHTQWYFELLQGFNICLYGVGSKYEVLMNFAKFLTGRFQHVPSSKKPQFIVFNGYNPDSTFQDLLRLCMEQVLTKQQRRRAIVPQQPQDAIRYLHRRAGPSGGVTTIPKLVIILHNLDGESIQQDQYQLLLAQLVSVDSIWLICSTDRVDSPLMWDANRASLFNFVFHDATTFDPYSIEVSFKDVLQIGKSKKFVGSKGAKYVLASLTPNARGIYGILAAAQLEKMSDSISTNSAAPVIGSVRQGVPFKELYTMAIEEFFTSNTLNFRTTLAEFSEHKMLVITKGESGQEIVYIPFSAEEIEKLLAEVL
ncbi:hypothetical protein LJB42_003971 [Komagataella kurtzmanii]|nr:hypothetical protein LJB42_003971 [Komagataella kurtzmanii]